MGGVRESSLKVKDLPVEQVQPNRWNVNRVPPEIFAKLREYVKKVGFLEPIVVRSLDAGKYEIIGGEHRWRIANELGLRTVPAAIVELDEKQARIASLNLNEMHGGFVPSLLAELLHELSGNTSIEDLASMLPWDESQLADFEDLLRVPDGLMEELQADADRMERERPRVLSFVVSAQQEVIVEEAVTKALTDVAGTSRGAALTKMAQSYMEREE